ncbi:MAG: Hsp20/alpha crystallin family protein [Planctomycetes bacterium]|nr:Hsp20/alpha crystallin family protein [Planctomycetota bacterium]
MREWGLLDSLEDMERLHRDVHRLFSGFMPSAAPRVFPPVNVWTGRDDAIVTAELPGVDPERLDISVVGDTLTLSGEREQPESGDGHIVNRLERESGGFTRTIQLPYRVEADKVEATYARGILQIKLPRLEADKPKQIAVKASA